MSDRLFRTQLPDPGLPLFDVHVHLGPSDTGELYYPLLAGDEYLDLMAATGVRRACAFSPLRAGYAAANAELRDWAGSTDGGILPFARLGGRRIPVTLPALWQVRRKLRALVGTRPPDHDTLDGFRGIKLLPHLDGLPDDEVLADIRDRALPVLVHGGIHVPPAWIEKHLVPWVRGPLIVGHLGSFPCGEPELRAAVDLARRHDNVYLETSGAWLAEFVRHAAAQVPHKLLFGSDAPLTHPLVAWHHVAAVIHDDDLLARISHRTAEEILL